MAKSFAVVAEGITVVGMAIKAPAVTGSEPEGVVSDAETCESEPILPDHVFPAVEERGAGATIFQRIGPTIQIR